MTTYIRLFLLILFPSSGSSASELLDPLSLSELLPSFSDTVSLIRPSTSPVSSVSSVCGRCVCVCVCVWVCVTVRVSCASVLTQIWEDLIVTLGSLAGHAP